MALIAFVTVILFKMWAIIAKENFLERDAWWKGKLGVKKTAYISDVAY